MGCDQIFTCEDCKTSYDLGYGSYSSWISATNMNDFNEQALKIMMERGFDPLDLRKNQALRECIQLHEGHKVHLWSHDYACRESGNIVIVSGTYYDILVKGGEDYEWIVCGEG